MQLSKGNQIVQEKQASRAVAKASPLGDVLYVSSNNGNDGNDGLTKRTALQTLTRAVALALAGDTIVLEPGGTETVTAAIGVAVARLKIICPVKNPRSGYAISGAGTLDLISVTAADAHISGLQLKHTGATASASGIKGSAAAHRLTVENCVVDDMAIVTTKTGVGVEITAGADDVMVRRCTFLDTKYGVQLAASSTNESDRPVIEDCVFHVGGSAFFGIHMACATGKIQAPRIERCAFMEADGDGSAAGTAWDGSDGTNGTQGPILMGAAVDQYVIRDCVAYTALAQSFDTLNAINAGAAGDSIANRTGEGGDVEDKVDIIDTNVDTLIANVAGAGGIATWPDPAAPADAVSLSEGLRWVSSRIGLAAGINPLGSVWYVAASGGNDSSAGTDPTEPLATIAQAISNASAGDTIVLGPGTHSVDVSAAALIPKADLKFVAAIPPHGGKPSTIITHDADDGADLITVDVDGVVYEGIEFLMVAGGTTAIRLLSLAQTTAINGIVFRDCWFNLNSVDAANVKAIAADDATNAVTGLVLKNCRFIGGDATTNQAVYVNVGVGGIPNALIEDNIFILESADGDAKALLFGDPGAAAKCYGMVIRNNDFIGPSDGGGDAVPIEFNAGMTEDEIVGIIRTNYFAECSATPITQDKVNGSLARNYVGDDATGGTLVDPGT